MADFPLTHDWTWSGSSGEAVCNRCGGVSFVNTCVESKRGRPARGGFRLPPAELHVSAFPAMLLLLYALVA